MCGILGLLGTVQSTEVAEQMRHALRHRGPDSWGEWQEDDVWLAHLRLAVLDLSPHGHQPMHSICGRFVLTFNGEVYNYRQLREQLKAEGVSFQGESDTEVVLKACVAWGLENAVKQFEGMFALGFYDRFKKSLWLARDPMGIKPLYYAQSGEYFAFSSELTPLLPLSWIDQSVDRDALFSYFRYLCVPAPSSILKGVRKLASGSTLRFSGGKSHIQRYWNLPEKALQAREAQQPISLSAAADELESRLIQSVRLHMQSDVPYGGFLSGGIDSSTIVALMQAISSQPVKTFSVGFAEGSHDESAHARAVAKHLGTAHHELRIDPSTIPELIPDVMAFYDEPFADNSAIPTYLVSKFARESVTVCLSGDGGDELFGGYPRYFWGKRLQSLRQRLSPTGAKAAAGLLRSIPAPLWDKLVNPMSGYRFSGAEGLAYRVRRFAAYLGCERDQAYAQTMSTWPDPALLLDHHPSTTLGADAESYPDLSWSDEMMLIDQLNYLQDDILVKVDRASMAVSLESRVPLLTHPLVEWSWSIDSSLKLADSGDRGKLVLREVLYRYVPKELIERPKQGFGMPIGKWLRGPLREWAEDSLNKDSLQQCGLNTDLVRNVWADHLRGANRQAMIWSVLMYVQWHRGVFS
jgi:asparagine synthase (glutamine-hydrolysing)